MTDRVLTCVYCGHEYPQETPAWGDKVLTEHIARCEKHPMRAVVISRDRLRAALSRLVGASDTDQLRLMAETIRCIPTSDSGEDKLACLHAIDVLLEESAP